MKNKVNYERNETKEIRNFIIVVIVVVLCVGAIYLLTRAFVTKDLFKDKDAETSDVVGSVSRHVAIMGQLFNMPEEEYYFVIYNAEEGEYIGDMSTMVNNYNNKTDHLHIYTVNLANVMNKDYYDPEKVNENAKTLEEIKVGDITLIKIKNKKISKYIVDYSKMKTELGV